MDDIARTRVPGRDRHGNLQDNDDASLFGTQSLTGDLQGEIGNQISDAIPGGGAEEANPGRSEPQPPSDGTSVVVPLDGRTTPKTTDVRSEETVESRLNFVAAPIESVNPSTSDPVVAEQKAGTIEPAPSGANAGEPAIVVSSAQPVSAPEEISDAAISNGFAAALSTEIVKDDGVVSATSPGTDLFLTQPITVVNHTVIMSGTGSGMIRTFGFDFNPGGHGDTNAIDRSIASFPTLFNDVGTLHGGDGTSTFGLPDLGGRLGVGHGSGPGLTTRNVGDEFGATGIDLEQGDLPVSRGGNGDPIPLTAPSTTIVYAIATTGLFPSRSAEPLDDKKVDGASNIEGFIGEIRAFTDVNSVPTGWAIADGSLISINSNTALFSIVGTTYGGDGRTTFALPDLRGRVPVHEGSGPGLPNVTLGQKFGGEEHILTTAETPPPVGSSLPFDIHQPSLGINFIVSLLGIFPSRGDETDPPNPPDFGQTFIGEIAMFAGNFAPRGWAFADGQLLSIAQNQALFALFGTIYGGDGRTDFALPDLRGRAAVDEAAGFPIGAKLGSPLEQVLADDVADLAEPGSLIVTITDDVVDPLDQETSLREAIAFANGQVGADTVTFADGLGEAFENGGTILLNSTLGDLEILSDITIDGDLDGNGTADIVLDGQNGTRILDITSGTVNLNGLVLQNGNTSGNGGAILQAGTLNLTKSSITSNSADNGGGIYNLGTLNLANVTLDQNQATMDGGGIATSGGTVTSANLTLAANVAGNNGGGLWADGTVNGIPVITLDNATVTSNTAANTGGGLYLDTTTTNLTNTINLGNVATATTDDDIAFLTTNFTITALLTKSSGHDPNDVFDSIDGVTGGGALADNGGPIQTVALLASLTNPAIDTGIGALPTDSLDLDGDMDTGESLPVDARGFERDIEIPGVGATPDIGAFEIQITPTAGPDILLGTSGADVQQGLGGNDLFVSSAGADSIDGGSGDNDTADYSGSAVRVSVFLDGTAGMSGDAQGDTLTNVENLIGSARNDFLGGNAASNNLIGGDSQDILDGQDGGVADTLNGGDGIDTAYYFGATTNQVVDMSDHTNLANNQGEHTNDVWISIEGFQGADGFTNDLTGDNVANYLRGGSLGDTISGLDGADHLYGLAGNDTLIGGNGNDVLLAGAGTDTVTGGADLDIFYILTGDDIVTVTDWSETDDYFFFYQILGVSSYGDLTLADIGTDVRITSANNASFEIIVQNRELTDLDDQMHFVFG